MFAATERSFVIGGEKVSQRKTLRVHRAREQERLAAAQAATGEKAAAAQAAQAAESAALDHLEARVQVLALPWS